MLVSCRSSAQSAIKDVEPEVFQKLISEDANAQLLDVRTPGEYAGGHLNGAHNLDWRTSNFNSGLEELNKNKPIYLYCLSGGRSASAAKKLSSIGFKEVYNLKGGILAWKKAELPVETGKNAAAKMGMSIKDYKAEIASELPVLVNFYAPWCGPCRKMAPMLEELRSEGEKRFKFVKLNADENQGLMKELDVNEIPFFLVYKNGEISWTHIGLIEKDVLLKELGLN